MTIDIITLFPEMFKGPFDESMVKRAQEKDIVTIGIHNLRNWAIDERGTVDGHPYGGGPGMLLRPEPIFNSVNELRIKNYELDKSKERVVLLDAGGKLYKQEKAIEYSKLDHLICLCGHYEGVDYRIHEKVVDEVISVGDYVLTGGEIPTMVIIDSVIRLLSGVLNTQEGTEIESFSSRLSVVSDQSKTNEKQISENRLPIAENMPVDRHGRKMVEYPQYTRPEEFLGMNVPEVLLSGHHGEIEKWRYQQALTRTKKNRPDLLKKQ